MANKVLSIKMDEKDIERLKKYYEALSEAGFISSKSLSLNGLYKHLLLDYLDEDINTAFERYFECGISPKCINPEHLNGEDTISLANTYNLSEITFELYKKCVKEALSKSVVRMQKNAELFSEVVDSTIIIEKGIFYKMMCFPRDEGKNENVSFWADKAFEIMELQENEFKANAVQGDIEMISQSSLPDELKQRLISEIEQYDKNRKTNYNITHGLGITE